MFINCCQSLLLSKICLKSTFVQTIVKTRYVPIYFQSPLLNYETNWLDNISVNDFRSQTFEKCMPCNFSVRNQGSNSSPNDLIISTKFHKITEILPFVRTLRSTGCKATLVIITDDGVLKKLTHNHLKQIENCGIIFYNLHKFKIGYVGTTRFIPITDYIMKNKQYIDRIIMIDAYDVVFQGDPFTDRFERNR